MQPRNIGRFALVVGLLALLVLAPAASAASITITTPAPKPGDYTMQVSVSADFQLVPVQPQPVNAAGKGHIHYILNDKPCQDACAGGAAYATPSTSFTFKGLKAGDKVSAELVNNDHSSLSPRIIQSQTVAAAGSPGFEPLLLLGAALGVAMLAAQREA